MPRRPQDRQRETNIINNNNPQANRNRNNTIAPGARRRGDDEALNERENQRVQNRPENEERRNRFDDARNPRPAAKKKETNNMRRVNMDDEEKVPERKPAQEPDGLKKRSASVAKRKKDKDRENSKDGAVLVAQLAQMEAEERKREEKEKEKKEKEKKEKEKKEKEKKEKEKKEREKRKKEEEEKKAQVKSAPRKKYSEEEMDRSISIEQTLAEGDTAETGTDKKKGNSKEYNEIMKKARRLKRYMAEAGDGKSVSYSRQKQITDLMDDLDKDMEKYERKRAKQKNPTAETRNRLKAIKGARSILKEQKESIKDIKPKKNAFEVLDIAMKEEEKYREELAKIYRKNPTKENFDKMKDSVYRSMFLETLNDEYGADRDKLKKMKPEEAEKAEKKLRTALKSGFNNNLEVMKKIANESTFGVVMDKKIKENLADNKYVSHEKMKKLRDDTLEECFNSNKTKEKEYFKKAKKDKSMDKDSSEINSIRSEVQQLDMTAKMFGSKNTAHKVLGNKIFDNAFQRDSTNGMKVTLNNMFKPKPVSHTL